MLLTQVPKQTHIQTSFSARKQSNQCVQCMEYRNRIATRFRLLQLVKKYYKIKVHVIIVSKVPSNFVPIVSYTKHTGNGNNKDYRNYCELRGWIRGNVGALHYVLHG